MGLIVLIMSPIFLAVLNYFLATKTTRVLALTMQGSMLAYGCYLFYRVRFLGEVISYTIGGKGLLGISLYADTKAMVFILLTLFVFAVCIIYAYSEETGRHLFTFMFFVLQSLILMIFLSRDLFNLYLTLEISSVVSSILIMYKKDSRALYDGLIHLLTSTVGMLFFLLGVGYLYKMFGFLDMYSLKASISVISDPRALILPFGLIMTGICLKCAFFPLYSWLPLAHGTPGAPPIVSAILSGVYIKTTIYMFIRMRDVFDVAINIDGFFLVIGILTGVSGIIFALMQVEIKKILDFHTISQIGLILIGLSLGTKYGDQGAMLHMINHALFKALLVLCAGNFIKQYHTRNIYHIRGTFKVMPFTSIALIFGILGITGAPFFNGSVSKYYIQSGSYGTIAEFFINIINAGTVLSSVKTASMLFGTPSISKVMEHKTNILALFILALSCLLSGLFATQFMWLFLDSANTISLVAYGQKTLLWILFWVLGILIYKKIIAKSAFFHKGFTPDISFNAISALTGVFFACILGFAFLTLKLPI